MPVPQGYTLENENQKAPGPPSGYALESTPDSGANLPAGSTLLNQESQGVSYIRPGQTTGVAGMPQGMPLPGVPASPGIPDSAGVPGANTQLYQFGSRAASDARSLPESLKKTASDWWNDHSGFWGHAGPLAMGVGQAVLSPLVQINDAANTAVSGHPMDAVSGLLTGNPEKAKELASQGDLGGAAWEYWGRPGIVAGSGEALANGMKGIKQKIAPTIADTVTPKVNSSFANWIAGGVRGGAPQETAAIARPVFQDAANRLGWNNQSKLEGMFTSDTPTRNLPFQKGPFSNTYKGMLEGKKLADTAVDIADEPIQKVIQVAGNERLDPAINQAIIRDMNTKAAAARSVGNDALASKYDELAKQVSTKKTYRELNELKKNANNQMERMGAPGTISEQIAQATTPIAAWQDLGGSIRSNMYPSLQARYIPPVGQSGYFDLAEMGRREKSVLDARDGVYRGFEDAAHRDAEAASKSFLEKLTGESAKGEGGGSLYKTHVLKRLVGLEPLPSGKFNALMRRGIGEIGSETAPETVSIVSKKQPLALPPPPGSRPPLFSIPTGAPIQGQTGAGSPMTMTYAGPREIPNPNHQPMTGPSYFQQRAELGTTAETIPTSARGIQSPPRIEADQIGMGHMPPEGSGAHPNNYRGLNPPERSFTGPETLTEANFQHNFGTQHAPDTHFGTAASMETDNPALARRAVASMQKYMQTSAFKALPKASQSAATAQVAKLQSQLLNYAAGLNMPGPVKFQVHWTPADLGQRVIKPKLYHKIAGIAGANTYYKGSKQLSQKESLQQVQEEEERQFQAQQNRQ